MDKNIEWDLYRTFLGVMQEGSLSAAARALGSTQPTVGRHIAALEKALNITLFIRSQEGLVPTDAARALQPQALEMASIAAALARVATSQGGGVRGVVRVTCSEVVGLEVLPPIIAPLRERYPDLALELVLTDRPQDLLRREADIAVRMFRPEQTQLIARRLGQVDLGMYARRDYLDRHGMPSDLNDLSQHSLIGFDESTAFIRQAAKLLPNILDRDKFAFCADSHVAQLALIRAGAGIGVCQVPLGQQDERLVRLFANTFSIPMEVWMTMHEDLRNSPPCRAVFDFIAEGMKDYLGQ